MFLPLPSGWISGFPVQGSHDLFQLISPSPCGFSSHPTFLGAPALFPIWPSGLYFLCREHSSSSPPPGASQYPFFWPVLLILILLNHKNSIFGLPPCPTLLWDDPRNLNSYNLRILVLHLHCAAVACRPVGYWLCGKFRTTPKPSNSLS